MSLPHSRRGSVRRLTSAQDSSSRNVTQLRLDTQMTSVPLDVLTPVLEEAPTTPKSKSEYENHRRGRHRRRLGGSIHERVRGVLVDLLDLTPSSRTLKAFSLLSAICLLYTFTICFRYRETVITSREKSTGVTATRLGHWISHWSGKPTSSTASHATREPIPVIKLPPRPVRIESHDELLRDNAAALESWMQFGVLAAGHSVDFSAHAKIDSVTYWVNGSDPRHRQARNFYAEGAERVVAAPPANSSHLPLATAEDRAKAGEYQRNAVGFLQNSENRFREANELLYSLRGGYYHLGEHLGTQHVVSTDFWPSGYPEEVIEVHEMAPWEPEGEAVAGPTGTASAHTPRQTTRLVLANPVASNIGTELLSSEFKIEGGGTRHGQLPQWLNVSAPGVAIGDAARMEAWNGPGDKPLLRVHHDWSTFIHFQPVDPLTQALPASIFPPEERVGLSAHELALAEEEAILQWKLERLPTFNSMAAEASLGLSLPGLSEAFFYSNDDMFIGRNLTTGDFVTPLYGPVLHLGFSINIEPMENPPLFSERTSHEYSAWLLARRFGNRVAGWPYPTHVQKAHLKPILHEARLMWAEPFENATSHRWRADGKMANSHMLSYSGLLIERHREALLWSFFVARLDQDGDGTYSDEELRLGLNELGDENTNRQSVIDVKMAVRHSALHGYWLKNLEQTKFPTPNATKLIFTSQDGYVLIKSNSDLAKIVQAKEAAAEMAREKSAEKSEHKGQQHQEEAKIKKRSQDDQSSYCDIDISKCWPRAGARDPVAVFQNIAFQIPECGDCVVLQLVGRSGLRGLSAFLPTPDAIFPDLETDVNADDTTPHLPLNDDWRTANFSLPSVARLSGWKTGTSRRQFCNRLIQRYSYSIGSTPYQFHMAKTPANAEDLIDSIKKVRRGASFICINDNIVKESRDKVVSLLQRFFKETWPWPLPFELSEVPTQPELA